MHILLYNYTMYCIINNKCSCIYYKSINIIFLKYYVSETACACTFVYIIY